MKHKRNHKKDLKKLNKKQSNIKRVKIREKHKTSKLSKIDYKIESSGFENIITKEIDAKSIKNKGNSTKNLSNQKPKVKENSKIFDLEKDTIVGIFQKSRNFGFVVPDDKKLGSDIFISKKDCMKAKNNQKVVVKITKMPHADKSAEGKIIEIIGDIDQAGVDMISLIKEYDLPYEFPERVINQAKSISQTIDEKDIKNRRDLRNEEIFTIDGEDAKDLDDAVNVKELPNGNYMLGVHIADVSHYVKEGSALDKEAVLRGTSVYMLDRVIPMLPVELSNGICSLNEKQDRFAISCEMEINKEGKVVSSDIFKSVINVTKRMSYTNVQKILEGSDEKSHKRICKLY